MPRLGCRQPSGRTGTDPGGPLARGRARTCLPPAAGRPARRPAAPRPPPAGCPAARPRRPGRRGRRGRRRARPARRPARSAPASRRLPSSQATARGLSRETWAAGSRLSSAAACSLRARLPQAAQQPGHGVRVVEGDVGGGITAQQRGGLLAPRPPPAGCPAARPRRPGRRGRRGRRDHGAAARRPARSAPASRRLSSSPATAAGSSRGTWAAARSASAAACSSRARLPQAVQQPGHGARVVEGDVGGGALGQRGGLLLRARLPQAVQQPGHGVRVVEGDVGGGSRRSSAATCSCAPASRRLSSSRPRRPGRRGGRGRRRARPAR